MECNGPERGRLLAPLDARLRSLHDIAMALSRAADESALCRKAVELCIDRLGFDRIGIWFVDPADPQWKVGSWGTDEGGRPRDERGIRIPRTSIDHRDEIYDGSIPYFIKAGREVYDDRSHPVGRSDVAIAPLWDGETVIGELVADNLCSARPIAEDDGEILALFARTVAHLCVLKRSEAALKTALEAKAVLLGELQHRTKNSFALMRSLISIEAGRAGDLALGEALRKLRDRVSVLTTLYANLDDSAGLGIVELGEYLGRIAADLLKGYGAETRGISLSRSSEPVPLHVKRAVPLGLIVNELVTDALKHAFPEGRGGTIALGLHREGTGALLTLSDDGVGFPPGFDFHSSKGFGIALVDMLCGQIGGSLAIGSDPSGKAGTGASFLVRFEA